MKNINDCISNIMKDIEKIINDKSIENRIKYINEIYNKMLINNIIRIKFRIKYLKN